MTTALRAGIRRGLTEFGISLRTPGDVLFIIIGLVIVAVVLWLNRDAEFAPGAPLGWYVVPSVLTIQLLFIATYGLATVIVTEREDGTLMRARSLPSGLRVYAVGVTTRTLAEIACTVLPTLVIAAIILGGDLGLDALGVLQVLAMLALGTVALTPFGFVVGTVFRNPRAVGGWGFLVVGAVALVSGLFQPLSTLPAWVQPIGLVLPLYWIGHAMRSAFLPDEFGVVEIWGGWHVGLAFAIVAAWAVVGLVLAPRLLRRVARRETASGIEARRQAALQRA
ncbi:ABC transporter permease [Agromyces sp. CFH 90414]|uniref:Transport permease protein n=1 Tax=Agromyces agglutinans TaxID=2662258 RepID=A0A6I2FBB0_9MICO|nr:ABC transporter permease [Agromyces agglutinans]MRG61107.1 ABC transporter permease [Agromyces agglutinans]